MLDLERAQGSDDDDTAADKRAKNDANESEEEQDARAPGKSAGDGKQHAPGQEPEPEPEPPSLFSNYNTNRFPKFGQFFSNARATFSFCLKGTHVAVEWFSQPTPGMISSTMARTFTSDAKISSLRRRKAKICWR